MDSMSNCNQSKITEFLLVGFSATRPVRVLLFSICFVIYIKVLGVNFMIIALYYGSHNLRFPMYFFLYNLSAIDILLSTSVGPNLLCSFLKNGNPMSVSACVTQYCVSGFFTGVECFLLTIMAYDRYLAICKPLHYATIMTNKHCLRLVIWTWLIMFLFVFPIVVTISKSGFCGCKTLDYIYCDAAPLLKLSCSDLLFLERAITVLIIPVAVMPLSFIITTYVIISFSIFRISSNTGRQKAFSTCSSHLTVVSIFYGIIIAKYAVPSKGPSLNMKKIISLLYTLFTPLFNPIIYSLRNQEIWKALSRRVAAKVHTQD
ncbi:hypothetical protein XELAEV_18019366mg [Xenopus laevis]|uniref:Olfactory receptor n=1 Tax=Xenopus laevis TaxID=8355 RepID=A0A974DEY1_XENLA|nr:hypothetical protein XELAEV_18019366mg [Xenopus laevis]